jgi:hypothetical protein
MANVSPTGVTEIETMLGTETVRLVEFEIPPREAEMLVEPAAIEVTSPVRLTVAVAVEDELQVTSVVRSAVLPSL